MGERSIKLDLAEPFAVLTTSKEGAEENFYDVTGVEFKDSLLYITVDECCYARFPERIKEITIMQGYEEE